MSYKEKGIKYRGRHTALQEVSAELATASVSTLPYPDTPTLAPPTLAPHNHRMVCSPVPCCRPHGRMQWNWPLAHGQLHSTERFQLLAMAELTNTNGRIGEVVSGWVRELQQETTHTSGADGGTLK